MPHLHRRAFFGAASLGLAATLQGQAPRVEPKGNDGTVKIADEAAFQPNTLFLTWQRDPTTTMTVQWLGVKGETADTKIYYAEAGYDYWDESPSKMSPYPLCDYQIFRAELTDLTPGTEHVFKIGKSSPTYRFRTMPAKATDAISFVSGGDCGVNNHAIANNIQAARQDPMFAVIGGDLAYDNGKAVDINLAFLRNYSKHMVDRSGRLIPLLACLGNHEVDGGYAKKREQAPFFYALFGGLFKDTGYATLDFGDYLSLVMLDTGHSSKIKGDQTDWLEKTLRARADHPHVLVVNHVPAYPSFRKMKAVEEGKHGTGEEQRDHWVPLFEKYRVPVVLEHHDHTFKRTRPLLAHTPHANGVLYLGDGSWGRLRTPQKPERLPHMAVMGRDYQLSLHRIEGDERFHLALDEGGRVMDVSRSGQRKSGLVAVSGG